MNQLMNLSFRGSTIRMVMRDGEPWWVARDVCEALEISNHRDAVARLDNDEKDAVGLTDTIGRTQEGAIVNEPGLYNLVMSSRKPEAAGFKRWIRKEVLPSIRRDGMYVTPEMLFNPDHLLRVTQHLVEEHRGRLAAEAQVLELAPKAEFHDRVAAADDGQTIAEVAKILGTGEIRLFRWLRDRRILMDRPRNVPYQEYLDREYFVVRQRVWRDKAGIEHPATQTLVTGKVLVWLQRQWDQDTSPGPLRVV